MCYKSAVRLSNNSDMTIEIKALLPLLLLLLLDSKFPQGSFLAQRLGWVGM